jgi:hypothetical protein
VTDLEKLTSLLDEWEVPYHRLQSGIAVGDYLYPQKAESSPKVVGYPGFYTAFHFAPDGTFIEMGAWE